MRAVAVMAIATVIIIAVTLALAAMLATRKLEIGQTPSRSVNLTVKTDWPEYVGSEPITVSGKVSPLPLGGHIIISITNPEGTGAFTGETNVNSTGFYSLTLTPSGPPNWITGGYMVDAIYIPAENPIASTTSHFLYVAPA